MVKVALEVLKLAARCAILGVEQRFMTALALAVPVGPFPRVWWYDVVLGFRSVFHN
jgi:hypothetical protein